MPHPLQTHFDHVSALLRELETALVNDQGFQNSRNLFNEYLESNELELALHLVCDALLEQPHNKPSATALRFIADVHKAMDLQDDCVEKLLAL